MVVLRGKSEEGHRNGQYGRTLGVGHPGGKGATCNGHARCLGCCQGSRCIAAPSAGLCSRHWGPVNERPEPQVTGLVEVGDYPLGVP
jgi:hypothetical protein